MLVISQVPPPVHGSTVMTAIFLDALAKLHFQPILVDRRFSRKMTDVGKASAKKIYGAIGLWVRLVGAILRVRPKVCVLFATTSPGSLVIDWVMAEILRLLQVPVVLYLHTVGFSKLAETSAFWRWIVKRLFIDLHGVVTLSPALFTDIKVFAGEVPMYAVPNTVSDEQESALGRVPVSSKEVIFVSNLIPAKGAKDFILVAKELDHEQDVHFRLIGATADEAYTRELRSMIEDLHLTDRVTIAGPLYGQEKWDALANAAALIFPSRYEFEAQPLTIIEAMHIGTPVLAYKAGAIEDCVVSGITGWASDPGDVTELAEKLSDLLNDDVLWVNTSKSCQALYEERFSRAAYERNWRGVLS